MKFHYSDGLESFSENIPVQTSTTVLELLPELITQFLPHEYQLDAVDGTQPSSIALVQGQSELVYRQAVSSNLETEVCIKVDRETSSPMCSDKD